MKGSPIVPIRVPVELLATIDATIARSAGTRFAGQWSRSSFILQAIADKLAHMQRSNRKPANRGV